MRFRTLIPFLGTAVLGMLIPWGAVGQAQDQQTAPQDNGVEVLARGPVHEAFAEPTTAQPTPSPIVPRQPPAAIDELPPDQKPEGDNIQWLPGYWQWDEDRDDFVWVSGFWRDVPPDRKWVPGHWQQVQDGWQWTPGFWADANLDEVQYLPAPPASVDAGPSTPAPNDNSTYVPGCWIYRETRYFWRPGFWMAFRPGWVWVPAQYVWSPAGCIFVEGYWDRPLRRRGLLFAPIYLTRDVLARRDFQFVPSYVVRDDFLLGALFVRPESRHYFFGDYFEGRYRREGFVPWIDYRVNKFAYDPLFAYVRHEDRRLERDLRDLYAARAEGRVAAPPHTLVQQQKVIQNVTVNKNVTNVQNVVNNVTVLASLTQVNRKDVKLERINRDERVKLQQVATRLHEASQERNKVEAQLIAKSPPNRPMDKPRAVKLEVPKIAAPSQGRSTVNVPPPPPLPKHQEREIPKDQGTQQPRKIETRKEPPPPPKDKKDNPPPTKKDNPPPPPPTKKDNPPPPPKKDNPPPPPPKKDNPPPSPPKKDNPPPPTKKDNPPKDKKDNPPPPPKDKDKKDNPPTPPPRTEPPPKHEPLPPPAPSTQPPPKKEPPPPPQKEKDKKEPPPPPPKDKKDKGG
jgi:hypothetical protein